jgi:hypothetical protein
MLILAGCLVAHALIALVVPSSWWVPDLTLVGLVLTVGKAPSQWCLLSGMAGLFTVAWAVRSSGPILVGYLLLGWIVHVLARHWDATDLRVQCLMSGIASLVMTFGALWLSGLWSLPLLGLASAHVAMTGLSVPLVWRFSWGQAPQQAPLDRTGSEPAVR